MNLAIRFLSVINTIQLGAFRWGAMFLVITVAAIVTAGVFFRYVLNDSLSWSEELAKYAMLWLVFLGAPIALRLGVHPNIEIIISRFPSKATRAILAVMHLAVFIFCAFLAMKSHDFALQNLAISLKNGGHLVSTFALPAEYERYGFKLVKTDSLYSLLVTDKLIDWYVLQKI